LLFRSRPSLKTLVLSWCHLVDDHAAALGRALGATTCKLQGLNLFGNFIDDAGVQALVEGLRLNDTVASLRLGDNVFGDVGIQKIASLLRTNKILTNLDVCYSRIFFTGASALSGALLKNKTLLHLDLKGCFHEADSETILSFIDTFLPSQSSLKTLDLSQNKLEDRHALRIGEAFRTNKCLEYLDLSGNSIGDKGASALADGLRRNSSLMRLCLSGNKIGSAGITDLMSTLHQTNFMLDCLPCSRNSGSGGVTLKHEESVLRLCLANKRAKTAFERLKIERQSIRLDLWPAALVPINQKRDFLFSILRTNPQLLLHPTRRSDLKRRRLDEAFGTLSK